MTIFHVNCTLPPANTTFVTAPNVRSTLDILWSSLSILVLSTWSILHLNVPIQARPETSGQKFRHWVYTSSRKLKWMLLALIAPEWTLGKALSDLCSALYNKERMTDLAARDGVEWTLTHAFYANMGGFKIKFNAPTLEELEELGMPAERDSVGNSSTEESEGESATMHALQPLDEPNDIEGVVQRCENTISVDQSRSDRDEQGNIPSFADGDRSMMSMENDSAGEIALTEAQMNSSHSADIVGRGDRDIQLSQVHQPSPRRSGPFQGQGFIPSDARVIEIDPGIVSDTPTTSPVRSFKPSGDEPTIKETIRKSFGPQNIGWHNRKNVADCARIGKTDWSVDKINFARLREALDTVDTEDVAPPGVKFKLKAARMRLEFRHWYHNATPLQGSIWTIDARQLHEARSRGVIASLPNVLEADIVDQSKSDELIKILAAIQIVWLVIQLSVRAGRRLAIAHLEIAALAFSVCALIAYGLLWSKPQDIKTARYVFAVRHPSAAEIIAIANAGPRTRGAFRTEHVVPNNAFHSWHDRFSALMPMAIGTGGAAALFGALHCLAWDFHFPTDIEKIWWWTASLVSTCVPPFALLFSFAMSRSVRRVKLRYRIRIGSHALGGRGTSRIVWACTIIYLLSRLFIMVEIFRALFFLPSEAFAATWSAGFPHIS